MIRALQTLVYGIAVAVLIVVVAVASAVWVIGLSAKAALFGDPRASLAVKIISRLQEVSKQQSADITRISAHNGDDNFDGEH